MKKVLITGVGKGLGRALGIELAKFGHIIIGCSRSQTNLNSLKQHLLNISSHNHLLLNIDVVLSIKTILSFFSLFFFYFFFFFFYSCIDDLKLVLLNRVATTVLRR